MAQPKIVILDGHTLNPGDLSWEGIHALGGEVKIYDRTPRKQVVERARDASIILANKAPLDRPILKQLTHLQFICVTATGYNNIDAEAAREQGILVSNAVGYSTDSVAQHVVALLLELTNQVALHNESVQRKEWSQQRDFSYHLKPVIELAGKTLGIYGFGRIGQRTGELGQAFGMRVIATHKHPQRDAQPGVQFVDLPTLFSTSDVVSLHAPLSSQNAGIVNAELLATMRPSAFLINTARGGLINEIDLREALLNGLLAGAALDVLDGEPPREDHPLYGLENCLITPHMSWASHESRQRLMEVTVDNVRGFLEGKPVNLVVGRE